MFSNFLKRNSQRDDFPANSANYDHETRGDRAQQQEEALGYYYLHKKYGFHWTLQQRLSNH